MLAELRAANPDLNIEIVGVNMASDAFYNPLIISERSLPWLQETVEANVWGKWGVTWRDVRIVDSRGQLQAVYNLTTHDLANAQNRAMLKDLFLSAAKVVDTDGDQLPDDWELRYFGNLTANPSEDADGDGYDKFTEYAFGTNPLEPQSRPLLAPLIAVEGQAPFLNMTLRRRAGAFLKYSIFEADDLDQPLAKATELSPAKALRNLFDGSGTVEEVRATSASSPQKFIKIRVVPRRSISAASNAAGLQR